MGSAEQRGVGLTEQRLISITRPVRRVSGRSVVLEHLRKARNEHRALDAVRLSRAPQLVEVVIELLGLHAEQRLEWVACECGHEQILISNRPWRAHAVGPCAGTRVRAAALIGMPRPRVSRGLNE